MEAQRPNGTAVNVSYTEFLLLPFPGLRGARYLLAVPFFCLFVFVVTANAVLIYVVKAEESLRSPMCLLVTLLFAANLCGSAAVFPKMLLSLASHGSRMSLAECLAQMFFLYFSTTQDCNILLMMALDRYVAICHPLRYAPVPD